MSTAPFFDHQYRAFGLRWQSAFPLPELSDDPDPGEADVVVEPGFAPPPDIDDLVPGVRADLTTFWMEVPDVARFLVTGGTHIVVEAASGSSPGDMRAFLLGSAVGALLHQRGLLPLHASAVEIGGRAIAFVAPSGGGKSTLAMHLQHSGARVIADDLCAIDIAAGRARIWPGLRNLKLWRTSLAAIDRVPDGYEPVLATLDKYRVPVDVAADDRALDLAAVVRLDWGEETVLESLPGAEAVGVLVANTFRGQLVAAMGRESQHWHQCVEVFQAASVLRLARPVALDRLDAASQLVLRHFVDR